MGRCPRPGFGKKTVPRQGDAIVGPDDQATFERAALAGVIQVEPDNGRRARRPAGGGRGELAGGIDRFATTEPVEPLRRAGEAHGNPVGDGPAGRGGGSGEAEAAALQLDFGGGAMAGLAGRYVDDPTRIALAVHHRRRAFQHLDRLYIGQVEKHL